MRYAADENGRYPLSGREYTALCCLMGAVNALSVNKDELKDRLSLLPNGWRDMQLASSLLTRLYEKMMVTIPIKKLKSLSKEMRYMTCEVKISPAGRRLDEDEIFITNSALRKMVNRAISMDCTFCEKTKAECKKCELYRDIDDCYPFELSKPEGTLCPLAGATTL